VNVPAGETIEVSIEWELVTPGEYTLSMNGQEAGTITVEEDETPTPTTATPEPTTTTEEPTETTTTTPGFGIGVALIALLGAALLALRRRD
jgi:PGF-CTERM protein